MKLYIVPTPIGNLEDITLRALRVLKEVDFVLCEDTRTTRNLLKHYEIDQNCYPYHIHNEHKQLATIIDKIKSAGSVALASDAGTPGISDPGYLLIRECLQHDIEVECLPGATALIPALVNSGFPCDKFFFAGFLPHKKGKETALKNFFARDEATIFYESPHRILKTLQMMIPIFGEDHPIAIARELTKKFEETFRGTISEALHHFENKKILGEFVVVVYKEIEKKKKNEDFINE